MFGTNQNCKFKQADAGVQVSGEHGSAEPAFCCPQDYRQATPVQKATLNLYVKM